MDPVQEMAIDCPYCGEPVTILVDGTVPDQEYIEDCEVCCRPMSLRVSVSADGSFRVDARDENETGG